MQTKTPTKKQLEVLIKKAEKTITAWSAYRAALEDALSSNPPGKVPKPPKG